MPRFILHREGRFFEWGTISDSAISEPMGRAAFEARYRRKHGEEGMETLPDRLARALDHGTSCVDGTTFEDMVAGNRMGEGERELTLAEVDAWVRSFPVEEG